MKIFNLAEELEKERKKNKELEHLTNFLRDVIGAKQNKIDKAIEYIETHIIEDSEYENYMQCEREEKEELLNILEGE